jgi:Outer membrane protein beta-barrel domain
VIQELLVLAVLLCSGTYCFGQVEDSATAGSVPLSVGGSFSFFDASYASNKTAGLGTFIDYSPLFSGNLGVEGEGRWLVFGGEHDFSEYNYLVGPRYRFYLKRDKFQPYAKFLVGAGEINFPYDLAHGGYFVMAPGGGLDVSLREHWKLRADYEFQFWPSAPGIPGIQTGSFHPNGVSVGFVYRLFRSRYQLQPQ